MRTEPRLILCTCRPDGGNEYNRWPLAVGAIAVAFEWDPSLECGGGLHGALDGQGNGALFDWSADAVWLVAEIDEWVDHGGEVKTPLAAVVHVGDQPSATAFLAQRGHFSGVIGGTATAGNHGTATAGYGGKATAGDGGTATAGNYGTATVGEAGTLVLRWHDGTRARTEVAYAGEAGIKPDTPYRLNDVGEFVEVVG